MFGVVMYSVIFMPYFLVFMPNWEIKEYFEEAFLNFIFLIDLIINFLTPYFDQEKEIVMESSKIASHYFKGYFFIDFISCIPFS